MISIYTLTMGREEYLIKLVNSISRTQKDVVNPVKIEHHIGFQGVCPSVKLEEFLLNFEYIKIHKWENNVGAGEGNNKIIKELKNDIIVKLDDDALIQSYDFFNHVLEINTLLKSEAVFSPYPVGLINNPGGPPSSERHVLFGENTDTFYTLRKVHHVGGFSRIITRKVLDNYIWPNDLDITNKNSGKEDVNFSNYCYFKKTPLYYLENAIITEHQESTLGQHARYVNYFGKRF